MDITYIGDFTSPSGYARATRNHARALIEQDVNVYGRLTKHGKNDADLDSWWQDKMSTVLAPTTQEPRIILNQNTPEIVTDINPAFYNIAYLTFECDRIPNWDVGGNPQMNWVRQLNRMSEIWTTAEFMREVFYSSGVRQDMPINIFPHPIDLELYNPDGPQMDLRDPQRKSIANTFTFFSSFQWSKRKGPHELMLAFLSEFAAHEDVMLLIKTYSDGFTPEARKVVMDQLQSFKKYVRREGGLARIRVMLDNMPEDKLPELYRSADAYVTASYGEGLGLPVQEAMTCGVPCIVPNSSAFPDYVDNNNGWLYPTHIEPVYGMQFPWYEATMNWWRPDVPGMKRCMREAFEDRELLKEKGLCARKQIEQIHSFETIGKAMKSRLEEIQSGLL
jgi:glycosyltransferase involved in cell wall biosynthesis